MAGIAKCHLAAAKAGAVVNQRVAVLIQQPHRHLHKIVGTAQIVRVADGERIVVAVLDRVIRPCGAVNHDIARCGCGCLDFRRIVGGGEGDEEGVVVGFTRARILSRTIADGEVEFVVVGAKPVRAAVFHLVAIVTVDHIVIVNILLREGRTNAESLIRSPGFQHQLPIHRRLFDDELPLHRGVVGIHSGEVVLVDGRICAFVSNGKLYVFACGCAAISDCSKGGNVRLRTPWLVRHLRRVVDRDNGDGDGGCRAFMLLLIPAVFFGGGNVAGVRREFAA